MSASRPLPQLSIFSTCSRESFIFFSLWGTFCPGWHHFPPDVICRLFFEAVKVTFTLPQKFSHAWLKWRPHAQVPDDHHLLTDVCKSNNEKVSAAIRRNTQDVFLLLTRFCFSASWQPLTCTLDLSFSRRALSYWKIYMCSLFSFCWLSFYAVNSRWNCPFGAPLREDFSPPIYRVIGYFPLCM